MARLDFKLPDIGEGVTEGEIVDWFVRAGDTVGEDDPMVEVMTDKATVTIGAPCDARVEKLCFEVGAIAQVGQVILTLESNSASNVEAAQRSSTPAATPVGDIHEQLPGAGLFGSVAETGTEAGNGSRNGNGGSPGRSSVRPAAAAQRREVRTSASAVGEIAYFQAKPLATPASG
ncbi:MAG: hypothetical protein JRH14_08010 [Deltaproteobacteria bacterium]|nr:hypothetical protein [Deltaproteobacteria bacterium]